MIEHFKQKMNKDNGFTGQDIIIAVFIIVIFLSTFTTIMINLSNTSYEIAKVKRMTEVTTQIADKFDALTYEDVQATSEERAVSTIFNDVKLYKDMQATYQVTELSGTKQKKIKLKITYPNVPAVEITIGKKLVSESGTGSGSGGNTSTSSGSGNNSRHLVYARLNAQYPFNRPSTNTTESSSGYTYGDDEDKTNVALLKPIKFIWTEVKNNSKTGRWVEVKDYNDLEWYSIEENIWPTFTYEAASRDNRTVTTYMTKETYTPLKYNPFKKTNGQSLNDYYAMIWIPRMVRENGKYAYAYENGNKKIVFNGQVYTEGNLELPIWDSKFHQNSGTYKYQRGLLMSRNNQNSEKNDGWKDYINDLPDEIQEKIKTINMHKD